MASSSPPPPRSSSSPAAVRVDRSWFSPRTGAYLALLTACSLVLPVASLATSALVAFMIVRAPGWGLLQAVVYPLGAIGSARSSLPIGAVMGLLNLVWGAAYFVGPLAGGLAAEHLDDRWAFAVLLLYSLGTALFLLALARRPRPSPG